MEVVPLELTKSEMEIMDILWTEETPVSRSDLLEHENKSWKNSSVHILLNGLLQKGAIREAGFVRRSKTYGRTFLPTMSREEYFASYMFCHQHRPDLNGLFAVLLDRPEINSDNLDRLQEMLDERRKTL